MKRSSENGRDATARADGSDGPSLTDPKDAACAIDWVERENALPELLGELERRTSDRRRVRFATVAMVMLVAAGFGWYSAVRPGSPPPTSAQGMVSLPPRHVLPDGSIVELRDDAQFAVNYSAGQRRVILKRGEAYFDVVRDVRKPFVVEVGQIEVRAVGTEFSVSLRPESAEVLVTEGRVAVEQPSESARAPVAGAPPPAAQTLAMVNAGNRVVIELDAPVVRPTPVQPVSAPEMAERTGWRVPRLEFSGTPLGEAIAMFNRHNEGKFILADDSLASLKVSGFLRVDQTETLIRLLESDFGLVAERRGPREIVLRRAP